MRFHPTISVVIPNYRRPDAVFHAVESAAAQTHRPMEVIVVDDGSGDGSVERLQAMDVGIPLTVLEHESNRGGSAARNTGIAAAQGEWVAFLDSDDRWLPEKLERQVAEANRLGSEYGAVYCGIRRRDGNGRLVGEQRPTAHGAILESLLGRNVVGSTSAVMVRRELLERVGGFDESLPSCQDWELWLRLAKETRFAVVPEPLVDYLDAASGRISTDSRHRIAGHLAVYRKHLREPLRANRKARADFLFTFGEMMLGSGRPDWAARLITGSLALHPHSSRRAVYLLLAKLRLRPTAYRHVTFVLARLLRVPRRLYGRRKERDR